MKVEGENRLYRVVSGLHICAMGISKFFLHLVCVCMYRYMHVGV